MRDLGADSIVDVRPKLRPPTAVAGAGGASQSTAGGFAALRVDLRSIEDRLAALRDRLETLVHTDELAQLQAAAAQHVPVQALPVQPRPAQLQAMPVPVQTRPAQVRPQPQPVQPQPAQVQPQEQPVQPQPHYVPRVTPRPQQSAPDWPQQERPARKVAPSVTPDLTIAPAGNGSQSPALSAMHLLRSSRRRQATLPRPLPRSNGTKTGGAPAPVNGVTVGGASVNGVATNGMRVNGVHTNGVAKIFPNGAPVITDGAPVAPAGNGAAAVPALPVTSGIPAQPTTKLPTLADVRPAGRTEPTWIGTALRRLAPADREAAGRAIVGLLPIQGDVIPDDVAYDLVISDGAYAVTVTEEEVAIQRIPIPRPLASIDGRIEMTLESLGALPTTKRQRALLRSGSVRVSGRHGKRALAALHQVAVASVGLSRACEAGVVLPEDVLMSLVAAAIPPEWTIGHRFTIGVETTNGSAEPNTRLFLRVNDGGNVAVNAGLPLDIPTSTIRCTPEQLAHILLGGAPADATLAGDKAPIMLLQGWVSRLESGRL